MPVKKELLNFNEIDKCIFYLKLPKYLRWEGTPVVVKFQYVYKECSSYSCHYHSWPQYSSLKCFLKMAYISETD